MLSCVKSVKRPFKALLHGAIAKKKPFVCLVSAVLAGLFFVVLLFGSILAKGLPAFWQSSMSLPIHFDPAIVNIGPQPKQTAGESPAQFEQRMVDWQMQAGMVDWDALIINGMIAKDSKLENQRDELGYLYTSSEAIVCVTWC